MKIDSVFKSPDEEPILPTESGTSATVSDTAMPMYSYKGADSKSSLSESLSALESGGDYKATNPHSSAVGKYQFLWNTWKDKIKNVTGIKSKDEFASNPQQQERFYSWYETNHLRPEAQKIRSRGLGNNMSDTQLGKLIHFRGDKGARDYLEGKIPDKPESYNMSISKYIGKYAYGGPIKKPIVAYDNGSSYRSPALEEAAMLYRPRMKSESTGVARRTRATMLNERPFHSGDLDSEEMKIPNNIESDQMIGIDAVHDMVGKPKINIQKNPKYRANYSADNNTMNIRGGSDVVVRDYIAEAAHAYQTKYRPQIRDTNINKEQAFVENLPAHEYDKVAYHKEGTVEYDAHNNIEPALRHGYTMASDGRDMNRWSSEIKSALNPSVAYGFGINNKTRHSSKIPKKAKGGDVGEGFLNTENLMGVGTMLGSIAGQDESVQGQATSGALTGASTGFGVAGPVGAAVGGVIGLATGLMNARQIKRQREQAQKLKQQQLQQQMNQMSNQNWNLNLDRPQLATYGYGGDLYEAEKDEIVQGMDVQLEDGKQLASDIHKVGGKTHEQGGTIGMGGDRVFSHRLRVDKSTRDRLKELGISAKGSVADVATMLGKRKGEMEKKLVSEDPRAQRTGQLMSHRYDRALEEVYKGQEEMKTLPTYAYGGDLKGTEAVRNYQLYLNKKFGKNLAVTGRWDADTTQAYKATGKIDYRSHKADILKTISQPDTTAKSTKQVYLEGSTDESKFIGELLSRTPVSDNARKSVRGKTLKDTFARVRQAILTGNGDKDFQGIGVNGLPKLEKEYMNLSDQFSGNVKNMSTPRYAYGGDLPPSFNNKWGYNTGPIGGTTPVVPKFKYRTGKKKARVGAVPSSPTVLANNPLAPVIPAIAPIPKIANTLPTVGKYGRPKTEKPGALAERTGEGADSNGSGDDLFGYVSSGLADLAQRSTVSKIKTRPETALMSGPQYAYQDRSQAALRDVEEDVATTVVPDRMKGEVFVAGQRAKGAIRSGENQRRDQYNQNYSDQTFRTQAINTSIVNDANKQELNNQNVKTQLMGEVTQGTLGNLNTLKAEKNKRLLDAKRLALTKSAYALGRTDDLAKEELERVKKELADTKANYTYKR